MPRIPRYTAKRSPSGQSGNVALPLSIADQGQRATAGGIAAVAQGFGDATNAVVKIAQQRQQMRDMSAISDKEYQYDRFQKEYQKLASEKEFANQQDFDIYRETYAKALEDQEKKLLTDQNSRVQNRLAISFNQKRASYMDNMDTILLSQERKSYKNKIPGQISQVIEDHYTSPVPEPPEALQSKLELMVARNAQWFDEGELNRIALEQHAEVLTRLGRPDEAKKLINSTDAFSATEKTTIEKGIEVGQKAVSDAAEKELSGLHLRGELTTKEYLVRKELLTASADKAWAQILVNQRSDGNAYMTVELGQSALEVARGTKTLEEFEVEARTAASRPDGINGTEYKSIMSQALTQLKQNQAEQLSHRLSEARRVLVDTGAADPFGSNLFSSIPTDERQDFIDKIQLQNWHVSQYGRELTEYLQKNPQATGKEFNELSEGLLYDYINRTDADVKALFQDRQKQVSYQEIPEDIATNPDKYDDSLLLKAMTSADKRR